MNGTKLKNMNTKIRSLFCLLLLSTASNWAMDKKNQQSKFMTPDEYKSHLQKRQAEIIKKYLALLQKLSHKSRLTRVKEFIFKTPAKNFDYIAAQQLTHEEYSVLGHDIQTGNMGDSLDKLSAFGLSENQIKALEHADLQQMLERKRARDPERFPNIDDDFGPIKPPCGCCGS